MLKYLSRSAVVVHSLMAIAIVGFISLGFFIQGIWADLPDVSPEALQAAQSLVITDRNGGELYRFYSEQDRTNISLNDMPRHLVDAVVAIEDKRFFERSCIDVRALGRAALANIADYKSQGASTITQQLARKVFLYPEKTIERKVKEVLLACKIEHQYSKEEVLELYLNWISFGHGISGVQQAAKRYFGTDAKDLTIAQSAVLASLPQRPTYFNPYGQHRRTIPTENIASAIENGTLQDLTEIDSDDIIPGLIGSRIRLGDSVVTLPGRADIVLNAMYEQGKLTTDQQVIASSQLLGLSFAENVLQPKAPHFVLTVRDELRTLLGIAGDVSVATTIDLRMQELAEQAVENMLPTLKETYGANNVAVVALDLTDNTVLAYVGNGDFYDADHSGQIDMVRAPRQTGSAFKPIVYATLLENPEYSVQSYIYDRPIDPSIYRPFQSGYYGKITIATALARSRNIPAIRAFYSAGGEDAVLEMAARFGIETPKAYKAAISRQNPRFTYGWPLALGAAESSLLEMAQGFSVLARGGIKTPITAVQTVKRHDETLLNVRVNSKQVLRGDTAGQLTWALENEEAREPLWRDAMRLPFGDAAIKTGTSNTCQERDLLGSCKLALPSNSWALGYKGNLLVGVWIGNADGSPMHEDSSAILTAVPIWKQLFSGVIALQPSYLARQ